ncbi:MAG TPA: hypothetical protein VM166_04665 [Gemmatimonadaceae bacterium]|nr:hypothetical protein [Gemmatimonadaceae bacterium]
MRFEDFFAALFRAAGRLAALRLGCDFFAAFFLALFFLAGARFAAFFFAGAFLRAAFFAFFRPFFAAIGRLLIRGLLSRDYCPL